MKQFMLLLIALLLLATCSSVNLTSESARSPVYIVSGDNVGSRFPHNTLTLVNPAGWAIRRQVALPHSWAKNVSRDPRGRLWIGFSGNHQDTDNLLQIYSPQGDLLQELRPCEAPDAGISFAENRAFVACAERGFSGRVVAVNLDT